MSVYARERLISPLAIQLVDGHVFVAANTYMGLSPFFFEFSCRFSNQWQTVGFELQLHRGWASLGPTQTQYILNIASCPLPAIPLDMWIERVPPDDYSGASWR